MCDKANASMILFVIINSILLCYYLLFVRVSFACGVWLLVQLSGREESLLLFGKAAQVLVRG